MNPCMLPRPTTDTDFKPTLWLMNSILIPNKKKKKKSKISNHLISYESVTISLLAWISDDLKQSVEKVSAQIFICDSQERRDCVGDAARRGYDLRTAESLHLFVANSAIRHSSLPSKHSRDVPTHECSSQRFRHVSSFYSRCLKLLNFSIYCSIK